MTRHFTLAVCVLALSVGAGSAVGSGPPQTIIVDPIVFTDVNPCTGESHVVTLELTLRRHEFELDNPPRHHGNTTASGTIATSDGYSGRITEVAVDNGAGLFDEEEDQGIATFVTNGKARNDSGDAFSVRFRLHVTIVDGEPVVEFERLDLKCIG